MPKIKERGHGAREAHEVEIEIVEKFFRLPEDARLGVLRTLVPRTMASLGAERREGFLKDLEEELDRARRGKHTYDVRPGL